MVAPQLGGVLRQAKEELLVKWTRRTLQESDRYSQRPSEEVQGNLGALLDAIIEYIETGNLGPAEEVVYRVSESRARSGFAFQDTLTVIFAGIQECIGAIKNECDASGHSGDCFQLANQLLVAFSKITILHAEAMEEISRKDYAATAISDMADAYANLSGTAVIDRAVETIHDNFALDAAIAVREGPETSFSCRCDNPANEEVLAKACETAIRTGFDAPIEPADELAGRAGQRGTTTPAVFPIRSEESIDGALAVASSSDERLPSQDLRVIESIAEYVGVACGNSRLYLLVTDAAERVAEERSRLLSMLSGMEAAVYVADMDSYEILATNRTLEKTFGGNLVGRKCYEVLQTGQTGPCKFCTNSRLMKGDEPTGPYTWKFRNTATGRWYNCIDSAILWPTGKYVRLELAFDVTEAEEARINLENVKSLLELYNDLLLHDLGNFAGTALAYIDLALDGPQDDMQRPVESARGQLSKCRNLIEDVSRFARALTSADDARIAVDLNKVLDEAIDDVMAMHPGAKLEISANYRSGPHSVRAGAFTKDVFLNLLLNAVKFGEGKDVEVEVDEGTVGNMPAWRVSITDHGPGIPPEMKERLFRRYSRLERVKPSKGSGLGLSIAKAITDRYGGELRASDRVEGDHTQGARFSVLLPKA